MIRHTPAEDTSKSLPWAAKTVGSRGGALSVAGLFAGIGGVELGLSRAGHSTELLCELDPRASHVLRRQFDHVPVFIQDVRDVHDLGDVGLLAAGFPCQDLSQAGRTAGISGARSGLVDEVFRLLNDADPRWVLLENVPFMLALDKGRAMDHLVCRFTELGFRWAYRVVDSRAFGLPQRRRRVLFLASRVDDPREILLVDDEGRDPTLESRTSVAYGFYWTEGTRGLGWARDAVPTLKGGSSIGIPSPPAIWMPDGRIVTPHIADAERLQGFPKGWTEPCLELAGARVGARWKLIGNAVSVPVAEWVGRRLLEPQPYDDTMDGLIGRCKWPSAAWGDERGSFASQASEWPIRVETPSLLEYLEEAPKPLSARATRGFYKRATSGRLRFQDGFLEAVANHLRAAESSEVDV